MNQDNNVVDAELPIIKPTVGRVVLYVVPKGDYLTTIDDDPIPAFVTAVINDRTINIHTFDVVGVTAGRASVPLVQPGDDIPSVGGYCKWMPYQIGQAAKTEALGEKLSELEDEIIG